jgi:hypothetical protein
MTDKKTVAEQIKRNQALNKAGANTFTTTRKQNTAKLSGKNKKNGKTKKDPNAPYVKTNAEHEAEKRQARTQAILKGVGEFSAAASKFNAIDMPDQSTALGDPGSDTVQSGNPVSQTVLRTYDDDYLKNKYA